MTLSVQDNSLSGPSPVRRRKIAPYRYGGFHAIDDMVPNWLLLSHVSVLIVAYFPHFIIRSMLPPCWPCTMPLTILALGAWTLVFVPHSHSSSFVPFHTLLVRPRTHS